MEDRVSIPLRVRSPFHEEKSSPFASLDTSKLRRTFTNGSQTQSWLKQYSVEPHDHPEEKINTTRATSYDDCRRWQYYDPQDYRRPSFFGESRNVWHRWPSACVVEVHGFGGAHIYWDNPTMACSWSYAWFDIWRLLFKCEPFPRSLQLLRISAYEIFRSLRLRPLSSKPTLLLYVPYLC